MYFGSAISHSRFKWLGICFLTMLLIYCLTNQDMGLNTRNKIYKMHASSTGPSDSVRDHSENSTHRVDDSPGSPELPQQLYYVNSPHCKMPYIDPFSQELLAIYKPMVFETCTNESDLVTPIFDVNRKRYVLHIDEGVAAKILNSSEIEYNCYYQEITRYAEHDSYNDLPPRIYFSQGYVVPLHVEGMILGCSEAANDSNVLQTDAFGFIQYKPFPSAVPTLKTAPAQAAQRKPSVIMFGIDSISRINLRRTMPKVYKFLTRSGWYEMQGYNKVADNTFPNLMAILSGFTPDTVKETICDTDEKGCFARIPFIWKYLKDAGYLTAYAEDTCNINTFNYVKPGFSLQPTDYYYRPLLRAFESEMKTWKCAKCTIKYCIGRRIQSSYIYDYAKEFARRYVDERPIWGLFWSSSFSHDDYAMPSKMADFVLQYLLDFETDGVLDESIVIFFSDHGSRYGKLMYLSSGFLEERLPMMFIYLPPWFRAQYPEFAEALTANRNRLTSNYDLHNTLKHIAEIAGLPNSAPLPKANDCPRCQSLFYPVNATRTCADAGIPEHYCTCKPYKRLSDEWADRIAPRVIDRMNDYLRGKNLSSLCTNLTLSYIHKTEIQIGPEQKFHEFQKMDVAVYRTKFKVQQNSADFFATVVYNNVTNNVDVDVEKISRTNSYAEDSTCINDKIAKLYCICIKDLKPSY
ncbi:uncharacterized protein LOC115771821 [Drosophila novamexicana]|uniref:uncharacterized protein LOC115771821 n=1 Tax=Drosophila novamexicana TaxID=47314 RepID=UPI0011E59E16|nr:uncharacterized protein LOC115771821 [Drosophila novamexicana]